jgi:hypothetical protein
MVVCNNVKCRYGRNFGAAKISAEVAIGAHGRAYPDHCVDLLETKVIKRYQNTQAPLPDDGVPPY